MKPLNYIQRKKGVLQFSLVFGILFVLMFFIGFLTVKTGGLGVDVLENKHSLYSDSFRKKATLNYDIEDIIKRFYQINSKERNLSQHKKFQDLISDISDRVSESIKTKNSSDEFIIYSELVAITKEVQSHLDTYEEDVEKYDYQQELLEHCIEKYIEELEKKNKLK